MRILYFLTLFLLLVGTCAAAPSTNPVGQWRLTVVGFAPPTGLKVGFINAKGEFLGKSFENGGAFAEGLAPVEVGGKWGFINESGEMRIPPSFAFASSFHEGLAAVRTYIGVLGGQGRVGFIDKNGVFVIAPRSQDVTPFAEGLASVTEESGQFNHYSERPPRPRKRGYIDVQGNLVIPQAYEFAEPFSEGLALVKDRNEANPRYINRHGDIVVSSRLFLNALSFREGLAAVKDEASQKWGFIDANGAEKIAARFDAAHSFSQGRALVKQGEDWGIIDQDGKWILEPAIVTDGLFLEPFDYREGYIYAQMMDGWRGYLDLQGRRTLRVGNDERGSILASGVATVLLRLSDLDGRARIRMNWIDHNGHQIGSRILDSLPLDDADPLILGLLGMGDSGNTDS